MRLSGKFYKLLDQYLDEIQKYPFLVNLLKSDNFFILYRKELIKSYDNVDENFTDKDIEDKVIKYFRDILSIFHIIDEKIENEEHNVLVKTYNFDADKVIQHSRKLNDVVKSITYLSLILSNYEEHRQRREEVALKVLNSQPNDFFSDISLVLAKILNNMTEKEYKNRISPKLVTFREKITNELTQLKIIQENLKDSNLLDTLRDLNMVGVDEKEVKIKNKTNVLPTGEKLYTTEEVKNIFKISSDTTINNWIRQGLLKPIKFSQRNYFKKEDIEILLEQKT